MQLEKKIAQQLIKQKKTLAIAESCTGGLLSHRLTNIPGSSKFLMVTVVTYSNAAKTKFLKVPSAVLKKHGAVSRQVSELMARGIRQHFKTDFGIGITGIAGPDGGSTAKPVGLTFIALSTPTKVISKECRFKGNRLSNKRQATTQALKLLQRFL